MKTPVVVVYNQYSYSGVMEASIKINMYQEAITIGLKPSFALGPITKVLTGKEVPVSLTFEIGAEATWGGTSYYGEGNCLAYPDNWCWIWMWARPIFAVYHVVRYYYLSRGMWESQDLGEYTVAAVTMVSVIDNRIGMLGMDNNKPPDPLINYVFGNDVATNETYVKTLYAKDPYRSTLDFEEELGKTYDKCGVGLTLDIPLGAILTAPFGGSGFVMDIVKAVIPDFVVEFTPASMKVDGWLTNKGSVGGIGYDIAEYIYIRISKLQYRQDPPQWCFWCSPCYYKVPVAMYFRSV